jgi:hypothetical protein
MTWTSRIHGARRSYGDRVARRHAASVKVFSKQNRPPALCNAQAVCEKISVLNFS